MRGARCGFAAAILLILALLPAGCASTGSTKIVYETVEVKVPVEGEKTMLPVPEEPARPKIPEGATPGEVLAIARGYVKALQASLEDAVKIIQAHNAALDDSSGSE